MDKQTRLAAKRLQKETLASLTQVDRNLWTLEYKCPYGLDELLRRGSRGLFGSIAYLQRQVAFPPMLPDPLKEPGGCSAFGAKTPQGEYLLGRNFDYKRAPALVVWTAPASGYRSVASVDHNMMLYFTKYLTLGGADKPRRVLASPYASMDGVNEKGLACAILQVESKPTKQNTGKTPIMTSIALRAALDTCATVNEAIDLFASYDMHDLLGVCYHYIFADAAGGLAVVEYIDNEMRVLRPETPGAPFAVSNYFLSADGDNARAKGWDRTGRMCSALGACGGTMDETAAMDLLSRNRLYYHHKKLPHQVTTLWSEVFNCSRGGMTICANMNYRAPYRVYADRPGVTEPLPCVRAECSPPEK